MAQLYHIQKRKDHRRFTPLSIFIAFVILAVMSLIGYVWFTSRNSEAVIDTSKNKPLTGSIEPADADYQVIHDGRFDLRLPPEWTEKERVKNKDYNYVTYIAEGTETTGRELTVFVGPQHTLDPLTKIVPVKVLNNAVVPSNISPQCSTFTDFDNDDIVQKQALWEDVRFPCSPNPLTNYIGAGTVERGYGFEQRGTVYYLRFTDHSARPDNSIFLNILRSFNDV